MYKELTLLLCIVATIVSAFKSSSQCRKEYDDSMKCFMKKTNSIYHESGYHLDRIQDCAVEALLQCVVQKYPIARNIVDKKDLIIRCLDKEVDRNGGAVKSLISCVKKDFNWFVFPNFFGPVKNDNEQPGLRMVGIGALIYSQENKCSQVRSCLPRDADKYRSKMCDAQNSCFRNNGHDTRTSCVKVQEDFRDTMCRCWNHQHKANSRTINNVLRCAHLPKFVIANKMAKEAKKQICTMKVEKAIGIC